MVNAVILNRGEKLVRNKEATIKKILQSAKDEFTEHGFEQASVRIIAKNAGVTPGAIYKHFKSKEDIFKAIVSPILNHLYTRNKELTNQAINEIKLNGLECFERKSDNSNEELLRFIYQNFSVFNLLFNCSQGTEYEFIRNDLVNLEVQGAKKLIEVLKEKGIEVNELNDDELHILYTMACTPLFEIITHQYSYKNALNFISMMEAAMNFGWGRIIK